MTQAPLPPASPSIGDALGGAIRDVWPALQTWLPWGAGAVVVVTGLGATLVPFFRTVATTTATAASAPPPSVALAFMTIAAVLSTVQFFAKAAAVRTVRPEFRMNAVHVLVFLGYSCLVSLITMVGFVALIVPGMYLLVRVTLAPYAYLLGANEPLPAMWNATKGRFWITCGFIFLAAVIAEIGLYLIAFFVAGVAYVGPSVLGAIVAAIALSVAVFLVVLQFTENAYVRWTDELLRSAAQTTA